MGRGRRGPNWKVSGYGEDRKLAIQVLGRTVHLAPRLAQNLGYQTIDWGQRKPVRGLKVSASVALSAKASGRTPLTVPVPPARSGLQRVTLSVSAHPAELHYSSRNAPRGRRTDALPPPGRLVEAFTIPAVCPKPSPPPQFLGFLSAGLRGALDLYG